MLFSSATFLFAFLPVVALLYYLIPKRCTAARNLFLTGASLLFYAWGEPRFVLVMLLVTCQAGSLPVKSRRRQKVPGRVSCL